MDKWISVEDRLPEDDRKILMLVEAWGEKRIFSGYAKMTFASFGGMAHKDFYINLPKIEIMDKNIHINCQISTWHVCCQDKHNKVTHWMAAAEL
jgi:hypothetical protein